MHSNLNQIHAQVHVDDLRQAAAHDLLVRSAKAARHTDRDRALGAKPIGTAPRRRRRLARALAWAHALGSRAPATALEQEQNAPDQLRETQTWPTHQPPARL